MRPWPAGAEREPARDGRRLRPRHVGAHPRRRPGGLRSGLEPGVGIYIDDVYYPSLTGSNFDLLDLDRVEIARGPQGVLGGRNSEGGSIKLFSQKPKGDGSGSMRATWGAQPAGHARRGRFALVPDTLSVRISGVSRKQDGYVSRYDYGCTHPGVRRSGQLDSRVPAASAMRAARTTRPRARRALDAEPTPSKPTCRPT
ncbi:MAG: hypothetical protein U1F30_00240 [Steroidobacteraceae bacterium]